MKINNKPSDFQYRIPIYWRKGSLMSPNLATISRGYIEIVVVEGDLSAELVNRYCFILKNTLLVGDADFSMVDKFE